MEQPLFIKHLPLMLKMSTYLDVSNRFKKFIFFFRVLTLSFFLFSTILCSIERNGFHEVSITMFHDFLVFFTYLAIDIFIFTNKTKLTALIKLLTEPFKTFERNTVHSKIVEGHNKEVNLYCVVVTTTYLVCGLSWYLVSLVTWLFTSNNTDEECVRVVIGWVRNSEYNIYLVILNIICILLGIPSFLFFFIVMFCMIIRIKYNTRLLCASLDSIDGFMCQLEEGLKSNESDVQQLTKPDSRAKSSLENVTSKLQAMDLRIQIYLRERIIQDQVAFYFKEIVEQHIRIIEQVKQTEHTFRHSVMFFVQIAVIILALAIPKISLSKGFLRAEYLNRGIEVLTILLIMGLFNYIGQIVLDESENLRQTLYNCDWTDKPYSLRRGLLIMQIVATKPLKLTLGGIYTLSMETYTSILSAAHTYTSVFQSLHADER